MGLGACSEISLASAREIADNCRKLLKQGLDPIEVRKRTVLSQNGTALGAVTFREAADRYIAAMSHLGATRSTANNGEIRLALMPSQS